MKFIDLPQNLKKEIKTLYILKGEDDFVIKSAIKHISNACGNEMGDFNKIVLTDENFNSDRFLESSTTLPIGNDRKLVLVKGVSKLSESDKQTILKTISILPQTVHLMHHTFSFPPPSVPSLPLLSDSSQQHNLSIFCVSHILSSVFVSLRLREDQSSCFGSSNFLRLTSEERSEAEWGSGLP